MILRLKAYSFRPPLVDDTMDLVDRIEALMEFLLCSFSWCLCRDLTSQNPRHRTTKNTAHAVAAMAPRAIPSFSHVNALISTLVSVMKIS
jgi:hypothetical protein